MKDQKERLHFIGIGGIGVSAVARIALGMGHPVQGSDVRASRLTRDVERLGADVRIGHSASHLDDADVVVYSTAIPEHNVELQEARRRGVKLVHRADLLARFVAESDSVGVTGTHGKGTVSAMIAHIMKTGRMQPGYIIGGILNNYGVNAEQGDGRWLVAEVDESDGSHGRVFPKWLVCNYLEADHLNYYRDRDDIIETMKRAVASNERLEALFLNVDCDGNRALADDVQTRVVTYGVEEPAEVSAQILDLRFGSIRFRVTAFGEELGVFELSIPGAYNVVNALAALAVTRELGVDIDQAREALRTFEGLENRFSVVKAGGRTLVKDYNSHPTAMRKVLEFGREMGGDRVISVFKPYRYTLMNYLRDEYATAFDGSDEVVITRMYAADEDPIPGVSTESFVDSLKARGHQVTYLENQEEIVPYLQRTAPKGSLVFFFGGDDFFEMADAWAAAAGSAADVDTAVRRQVER